MKPPRFAVIGTGRCGTGYMSALLRQHGINCGHENWWTASSKRKRSGLDGDSSWMALPDIESGAWSGPVVHIVRHPIAVVRSFVALGFPDDIAFSHMPDMVGVAQPVRSVEWWCRWNDRCAAVADLTVRVEDVVHRLDGISAVIGRSLDRENADRVPTTVNSRRRADVDGTQIWRLVGGRADQYGYTPCS